MKNLIISILVLFLGVELFAQAPNSFRYQSVARDNSGNVLTNQAVSFRISILSGSAAGSAVYRETHTGLTTNTFGLVELEIGKGTPETGTFSTINWGNNSYYVKVEMDPAGGTAYQVLSTSQLLTVPYAFHAQTVETDNVDDADANPLNEIQELSLAGTDLSLSEGGGSVSLSPFLSPWTASGDNIYKNTGNVGIGTSSPDANLNIYANSSLADPHILLQEDGNDYARINLKNNNGDNYWTIAAYIGSNNKNDRLNFWNGTGGDLLTLTGDGELGLGVGVSPKTAFHIGDGNRVLWGTDTIGSGDKLMWLPDLHAFRVGTVATGAASTYWNRDSIGLYSFASGLNTRAQGFGATAMGRDTEATNSYAFASGYFSNADGQYSTAMGFNTDAFALGSTALGYSTDAEANYSFAAGYFAEAQAIYSVAIGNYARAQSYSSTAFGRYNVGGGNSTSWLSSDPIFEIGIGTSDSDRENAVTVRKDGNVGIGTTVPLDRLHVNGRIRLETVEYIEDGGTNEIACRGDIRPTSDNTYDLGTSTMRWDDVFATNGTIQTSDARLKSDIKVTGYGLKQILKLKPVNFHWKSSSDKSEHIGLLAQDLLEVIPEVVKTHDFQMEEDGTITEVEMDVLGVNYSNLIPVLIKAIQEQQEIIQQVQTEVESLKKQLADK